VAAQVARDVYRTILVIGGGIAGVTAAIEAAGAGYDVIIVEKNPYLGSASPNYTSIFQNSVRRTAYPQV
jgi:heterodisulfide reductase subunit A-like polyferredoxin